MHWFKCRSELLSLDEEPEILGLWLLAAHWLASIDSTDDRLPDKWSRRLPFSEDEYKALLASSLVDDSLCLAYGPSPEVIAQKAQKEAGKKGGRPSKTLGFNHRGKPYHETLPKNPPENQRERETETETETETDPLADANQSAVNQTSLGVIDRLPDTDPEAAPDFSPSDSPKPKGPPPMYTPDMIQVSGNDTQRRDARREIAQIWPRHLEYAVKISRREKLWPEKLIERIGDTLSKLITLEKSLQLTIDSKEYLMQNNPRAYQHDFEMCTRKVEDEKQRLAEVLG